MRPVVRRGDGPGPGLRVWVLGLAALLALASGVGAWWAVERERGASRAAARLLDEQPALLRALARHTADARRGVPGAFSALRGTRTRIERHLADLDDARRGGWQMLAPPAADAYAAFEAAWAQAQGALERLLAREDMVLALEEDLARLEGVLVRLAHVAREVVDIGTAVGWSPQQGHFADRQALLARRVLESVRVLRADALATPRAAVTLNADQRLLAAFGKVHNGLLLGDASIGVARVHAPASRRALESAGALYRSAAEHIQRLARNARALTGTPANPLEAPVARAVAALRSAAARHDARYREAAAQRVAALWALAGAGGLAALALAGGARSCARRRRRARRADKALQRLDSLAGCSQKRSDLVAGLERAGTALEERLAGVRLGAEEAGARCADARCAVGDALARHGELGSTLAAAAGSADALRAGLARVDERTSACAHAAQEALEISGRASHGVSEGLLALDDARRRLHDLAEPAGRLAERHQALEGAALRVAELAEEASLAALNVCVRAARAGWAELEPAAGDLKRLAERAGERARALAGDLNGLGAEARALTEAARRGRVQADEALRLGAEAGAGLDSLVACQARLAERVAAAGGTLHDEAARAAELARRHQAVAALEQAAAERLWAARSALDGLAGGLAAVRGRSANGGVAAEIPATGAGEPNGGDAPPELREEAAVISASPSRGEMPHAGVIAPETVAGTPSVEPGPGPGLEEAQAEPEARVG